MTLTNKCCTVRANVGTNEQAKRAIAAGAEGIGLYRTEAMLLATDSLSLLLTMIVAPLVSERSEALETLLQILQGEFEELFRLVAPLPLTIRLPDPPLQEFLPSPRELASALASARKDEDWYECVALERVRIHSSLLIQGNPSIGHSACRLSLTNPELLHLQVRAILQAAVTLAAGGLVITPEIMVPLVSSEQEMRSSFELPHWKWSHGLGKKCCTR